MMPEPVDLQDDASLATGCSGCAVFLIDESTAMDVRLANGTKSKAASIATAINSLLNQLAAAGDTAVGLLGYRADGAGAVDVGSRFGGALAGRMLVPCAELAAAPLAVEDRVRRLPGAGGIGVSHEEIVRFPLWYVPTLGGSVAPTAAYQACYELLAARQTRMGCPCKPPLLVSFVGDWPTEPSLPAVAGSILGLASAAGPPLLLHAHLSSSARIPPTLYPSADAHLPPGKAQELFHSSSVLPEMLLSVLRQSQVAVNAGARGLILNATMADLIRLLTLVRAYAQWQPATAAAVPRGPSDAAADAEPIALVVLLLDRSVQDPAAEASVKTWRRLQEHANDLLGQIGKRGRERIETAVLTYGAAADGQTEVQNGFAGPLAGQTIVGGAALVAGALRIDEISEKVSNGIGGLISLVRKKPIYIDVAATAAVADTAPAWAAVAQLAADWCGRHPQSAAPPIVLHLTRGRHDPAELAQAMTPLWQGNPPQGGPLLYHLLVTESPHRSLSYPDTSDRIDDPLLAALWQWSSPLLGAARLAAQKRPVTPASRAIVINGKFDLLLEGILERT